MIDTLTTPSLPQMMRRSLLAALIVGLTDHQRILVPRLAMLGGIGHISLTGVALGFVGRRSRTSRSELVGRAR